MKVFISWSGELSQKIAKELSEWLPSIIQSIEVFYSSDDIKKGENWDNRLTNELQDSEYGIVCLTSENVSAPWIHFEAGALSKTLDSRVSALMINVVTSEIQGPLSRFQATKIEKEDFYKLLTSINEASGTPINEKILQKSFDAIWDKMYANITKIIDGSVSKVENVVQKSKVENSVLEELLQLVRKQDSIISNPEKLIPLDYLEYVQRHIVCGQKETDIVEIIDRYSIELRYKYENEQIDKEVLLLCYKMLIDLAEQFRCERSFVRYLQNKYMDMGGIVRRKVKLNQEKVEVLKKAEQECL
ncbi:MAG: toll/interleukin-1 receptor domain-containing protein [Lachnospiraceae bacterium]|nr:toll/interleukin-1 receptor domain-containing protein [Lachnospiraceae bacterium]